MKNKLFIKIVACFLLTLAIVPSILNGFISDEPEISENTTINYTC